MTYNPTTLSKMNQNLIERERRSHMKTLFSRLSNLLPPHPTKMSMPVLVENATVYIKQVQERVEQLKRRRVQLEEGPNRAVQQQGVGSDDESDQTIISPVLEIADSDSNVEVHLVVGTGTRFALRDIITILEEEGAEVVSVNYHTAGNRILLSLHSQAAYTRIGIENCRVHERLKRLQISLKD